MLRRLGFVLNTTKCMNYNQFKISNLNNLLLAPQTSDKISFNKFKFSNLQKPNIISIKDNHFNNPYKNILLINQGINF